MHAKQILAVSAAALVAAALTFSAGAGTALAPEPAKLTSMLNSTTGATAAAVFVNTSVPTRVLFWNSSWIAASTGPAAGTPCSSTGLPVDRTTTQVIQTVTAGGSTYRRCY